MSDPVTNAEVEDVLSSIRRLVSEDKRPLQTKQSVPANDRLVLTPALRVAEEYDDEGGIDAVEEVIVHDEIDEDESDEAEVKHGASQDETDASDDAALFDDPAHDYADDPYNFDDDDDGDADSDSDDAAALEAAPDQDIGHVEQDDADILDGDHSEADDRDDIDTSADDAAQGIAEEKTPSSPATLSAKIAALETAIGNIADTWEPDTPGSDEYSGTEAPAMAWEDDDVDRDAMGAPLDDDDEMDKPVRHTTDDRAAEPQPAPMASAPLEQRSDEDATDQDSFAYGSDDQLIDEEALRDLVSDIVRSELQGALGERITRNVRKLVRREIHRALTAQELE